MRLRFGIPAFVVTVLLVGGVLLSSITTIAVLVAMREVATDAAAPGRLVAEMLFWSFVAWSPFGILLAWWSGRRIASALEETRAFARDQAWTEHPARRAEARIMEVRRLEEALSSYFGDLRAELSAALHSRDDALMLVNAVGEGILQIDSAGRLVRLNPAAARLLRLPGEALGQAVTSLIRYPELRLLLEHNLAAGTVESAEITVEARQLLVVREPIPRGSGAEGWIVLIVDLTPMRKLEDVRRDFVANVSHELKTPLTAIRGYVETLQDAELPEDLRRQFMEATLRNASRLQRIVDDLLDLSRIESGGWRPDPVAVDVPALARDAWVEFGARARENGVSFEVEGEGAPAASADPGALRQILSNLYDNALRYTSPGGRVTVRVRRCLRAVEAGTLPRGHEIAVEVSDTGSGIPADALPRIFERFYRVDPSRSRAEGGTGLGLSIVKHLAEQMGGDVVAESRLGVGTTVRVTLPVAAPSLVLATQHE